MRTIVIKKGTIAGILFFLFSLWNPLKSPRNTLHGLECSIISSAVTRDRGLIISWMFEGADIGRRRTTEIAIVVRERRISIGFTIIITTWFARPIKYHQRIKSVLTSAKRWLRNNGIRRLGGIWRKTRELFSRGGCSGNIKTTFGYLRDIYLWTKYDLWKP